MNIALTAMSGVRACDEELLNLGLTLPGFVERSKTIASLPSLGLLTLAGLTPSVHTVSYIEIPDIKDVGLDDCKVFQDFDLVAISSYSAQIGEAYQLARMFRDKGISVVMGGTHVSALPEEALQYCDSVVIGEGEPVWLELLADCQSSGLKEVYDARKYHYEMAAAPMPAYELLDIEKYNRLTVQTSRGCPHRCDFCAGSVLLTNRYKQKPVEKVISEIDRIIEIWDHPFIEFADDNSFVDRVYWKELLKQIKGRKFRWFTETDISVSEDSELLTLMRESGCAQVLIGLESPQATGLSGLELKENWKFQRYPDYREAIRTIQSHGITVNGCFVLGLDGHTAEVFDQVMEFVKETELYEVQVTILTAFPGTPLYSRLEKEDRIIEKERWDMCTLFDVNFKPANMSAAELADGFKKLVVELYSDEFTRWRRDSFKKNLRKRA